MNEISILVETVTPLFIAGADQRNIKNEGLRVPSLRGLLRWWFRAIMGGMVASIDHLRELENEIFGSTEQKSKIRILSTVMSNPSSIKIPKSLKYLWFSLELQGRHQWYPPNTKFKIDIISLDKKYLEVALGCLWALIYLGSVGARMRRGAGCFKVNDVDVSDNIPYTFVFNRKTVNDFKKFIEKNLTEIFRVFKKYAGEKYNPQIKPGFAVLSKKCAKISLINKHFNKWEEGLEKFISIYKNYRVGRDVTERFVWGLPILSPQNKNRYEKWLRGILSKGLNKKDADKEIKKLKKLKEEELLEEIRKSKGIKQTYLKLLLIEKLRQASPLFIGVMNLNGGYVIRLVKFYTSIHKDFSPNLEFLQQNLDELDNKINTDLGEVLIDIPEV